MAVQLTDILIRAMLPLHPRLAKDPKLSIQLIGAGDVLAETQVIPQNRDGVWKASSGLDLPENSRPLNLAIVIKGQDGDIQLLSPEFETLPIVQQFIAKPQESEFIAHNSSAQIRVTISWSIGVATSTDRSRDGIKENKNKELQASSEKPLSSSREELKQLYLKCPHPLKSNERMEYLGNISHSYYSLYQQFQDAADLDNVISIQREAVDLGRSYFRLPPHLLNLSIALRIRYDYSGNHADIDEAIQASQNALHLTHRDAPGRADLLMQLASNHDSKFKRLGDVADIDIAVSTYSEAIKLMPEGSPNKVRVHSDFGKALLKRFERLGAREDLNSSLVNLENVVSLTPDGHPEKALHYNDLGGALQVRFKRFGALSDLKAAIVNLENAVNLTPDGHPEKAMYYSNLGATLQSQFERLGDLADIEMAITNLENAVRLTPDGHPDKPSRYNNLGAALKCRFENLGDFADLDKAISNWENTMSLEPHVQPEKALQYNHLGNAFRSRFDYLGDLADLEMAIFNLGNAVRLTPDGHPTKPLRYASLGNALRSRFRRLGELADIEMAITNLENAVSLTPDGYPGKPLYYNNLGNSINSRFERLDDPTDLDMAITYFENAMRLTPDGHPQNPWHYDSLGLSLQYRFRRLGDLADLNKAISNHESSVNLTPDGHPAKPLFYTNLGGSLDSRFGRLGDLTDLSKAISNQEKALNLLLDGHPDEVPMTSILASYYERRFASSANRSDLDLAYSLYATAAQSPVGYPRKRFEAATRWTHCARLMKRSPLLAFKCVIEQLPRIAWLGIPVSEQHSLLKEIGGMVRHAVAAALEEKEYKMAVEWMEQGRSIVWQNLLKLRAPVDDLHAKHPKLADRLHSISQQLDRPVSHELVPQIQQDKQPQDVAKSHASLAIKWDETIDEIRCLPNFKSFLKPKRFESLAPAAHEGPVVILNSVEDGCDALALVSDVHGVCSTVHILLGGLSLDKCTDLLGGLRTLLTLSGVRDGATRTARRVGSKADPNAKFKLILRTLWLDIMKPVMDALAFQPSTGDLPRIWWCATGPLAFLPIHAAGDYDKVEAGHKLSDYVVSSYTPTLTAILDPSYPIPPKGFKLLTVAQPSAPGYPMIEKTMEEVEQVAKIAGSVSVISLTEEAATVERVQRGMRESNWVHLACHGKQDASNPLESGLILHGGTLKLSTIVKEALPNAEFAFLSACQTAMGDEDVAEESVHLAAGMLLAGYRGVIATMWSIKDDIAPQVTEVVYRRMLKDGNPNSKEAAYALHEAARQLRDSGVSFTSWVPFIHIGR